MQIGKFLLKQHMIVIRPGNVAGAARPCAAVIKRFMHRPKDQRMLSHAKIIVGTPHADRLGPLGCVVLGPWKGSSLPFEVCEDPVATFRAQLVKLSVEEVTIVHCASCAVPSAPHHIVVPAPPLSNERSIFPFRTLGRPSLSHR